MKRYIAALLCSSIILASASVAQDTRTAELALYNRRLNTTYRTLMQQLGPQDQAALRTAQRAWIIFRDADCVAGIGDHRDCLAQRTDDREKQLRESTYWNQKGELISLPEPPENHL